MIKKCQKTKKPSKLATSLEHQDVSVNSWVLKKNWVCQCLCVGLPYYMVRAGPQFSGPCILPNESTSDSCRPSYYKELDTVFNVETNCQQVTAFSFMLLLCFNNKIIQAAKEIWWRPHWTLYPPQWGGDRDPHLIQCAFRPQESSSQTACWSISHFSRMQAHETDKHTTPQDHQLQ